MIQQEPERMLHPRDREIVALTYVLAIIPLFGILAAGVIALWYQERSRTVVFHAKQAIAGQAIVLLLFVVICLFSLFSYLVGVLSPALQTVLMFFNRIVFFTMGGIYLAWCIYFAWQSLAGYDMNYPLIGGRLRDRSE